jgi:uncharacterized membrane protein
MKNSIDLNIIKPEFVFLILASLFGLLFLLITPPFQVPDEYLHFDYAYAVSIGKLYGGTSEIPSSIQWLADTTNSLPSHPEAKISYIRLLAFTNIPLNPSESVPTTYGPVSKYNPIPYIPVAISIVSARFLRLSPFDLFYFGRIINLCVWIVLSFYALKILPDFKWAFLLLFLTPMSLFQAGSYSADVITNSISFLWVCICLNYSVRKERVLSAKSIFLLFIIAALLSFIKPPYFLLLGLIYLIPRSNFGSAREYKRTVLLFFGICFIILLFTFIYQKNDISIATPNKSLDFISQIKFLVTNPFEFPIIILRSIKNLWIPYWYSTIGLLGWLDTLLPAYIYTTYPVVVLLICLIDHQKQMVITFKQKLIAFLTAASTLFAALLAVYLTWSPVGGKIILGFQGRYLIPILPVFVPLFSNQFISVSRSWKSVLVTVYLIIVLCLSVRSLILRYYLI